MEVSSVALFFLVTFAGFFSTLIEAGRGVDFSNITVSLKTYKCLQDEKQNGDNAVYNYLCPRVGKYSSGDYDSTATQSILNAVASGISRIDGYIYLCPLRQDSVEYVTKVINGMRAANVDGAVKRLWMDVETTDRDHTVPEICWYTKQQSATYVQDNINSIGKAIETATAMGHSSGIYTRRNAWADFTNSYSGFSQEQPLWWSSANHVPTFEDFVPFGGWTMPVLRQYDIDLKLCGIAVDKIYGETYLCDNIGEPCTDGSTCCAKGCKAPGSTVALLDFTDGDGNKCCQPVQCHQPQQPGYYDCGPVCDNVFGQGGGYCKADGGCLCRGTVSCHDPLPLDVAKTLACDFCKCNGASTTACTGCCETEGYPNLFAVTAKFGNSSAAYM